MERTIAALRAGFKLHLWLARVLAVPSMLGSPSFAATLLFARQPPAHTYILREGGENPLRSHH
jgi:hypothetical protein